MTSLPGLLSKQMKRIDPSYLNLRACATNCGKRFAGSECVWGWGVGGGKVGGGGGRRVSWVAGRARSCICLVAVVVKNLAFHGDKMVGKDHCRVTTGRIKDRNPRGTSVCLFYSAFL